MFNSDSPLTATVLTVLASIAEACVHGQPVTILLDNGGVSVGTARALVRGVDDASINFGDVRDGAIWLTMTSGLEQFIPVPDFAQRVHEGTIAVNYNGAHPL